MDKKKLMDYVRKAKCDGVSEKFYRFAHDFISRLHSEGKPDAQIKSELLKTIREFKRVLDPKVKDKNKENVKNALGIVGNTFEAVEWCGEMIDFISRNSGAMTADDLDYIMGMCARKCKVNGANIRLNLLTLKNNLR